MKSRVNLAVGALALSFASFSVPSFARTPANPIPKANNTFAFKLLNVLSEEDTVAGKNIFLSPLSLHTAMAMVLQGSAGVTEEEVAAGLYLDGPMIDNAMRGAYYKQAIAGLVGIRDQDGYDFLMANHIWSQENFGLRDAYVQGLAENFNAGLSEYNFLDAKERAQAIVDINTWAANNTNNLIKEVVDSGSINAATRLVLTNATYFKGSWVAEFPRDEVDGLEKMDFRDVHGVVGKIDELSDERDVPYYANAELQSIELDYQAAGGDPEYSMLLILPKEGTDFAEFIAGFDVADFEAVTAGLSYQSVQVEIPAFELKADYTLGKAFRDTFGMESAFSAGADFSRMFESSSAGIDEVIHKTFIRVDNKGTEAAAVTAIVFESFGISIGSSIAFTADRPFLYAIRHKPTNTIAFLGTLVSRPEAN